MLIFVSKTFMLQTSNPMWILWKMRSFNKKYLLEQASKSTNFLQSQPFMENSWWSRNIAIRNPCFSPSYYFWRNKHMSRNNWCDISRLYEMCWVLTKSYFFLSILGISLLSAFSTITFRHIQRKFSTTTRDASLMYIFRYHRCSKQQVEA